MSFEKIKHATCAMFLMACAVNDTAKYWVAFITHSDSKNLKLSPTVRIVVTPTKQPK